MSELNGDDVICMIKNTATLTGSLFTLHASQIHIDLPTLSDADKDVRMLRWKIFYTFLSPAAVFEHDIYFYLIFL